MKIKIDNNIIEYNVQYGHRTKITIHMDTVGLITVKVPNDASEESIIRAVQQQGKWILEKSRHIALVQESHKPKEYQDKGKFLHLGKEYSLDELIETNELEEEELQKNLKKFYFTSCKKVIADRIKIYQTQLGIKPKTIEIVESRTKWGSCSADKKITFNYLLAMAPIEVIDYVIIHELCHLLHMNHDRSFWRRVGGIMPDYKEKEEFLTEHGHAMTL
ncbi:M48 family metallopeptidase [Paenibacillus glacialis]|uniref:YgjP-like metallopeptidase domain-containing protein n=1 Tax=Paenibacillus glacialis TaxID=494026 RepID=A0A168FD59_9BACL|nr:SprT family zinc-dependent metalloprotease [Paenibacillus glacialis]OAB36102.1 hypothetical protein PGLA_21755 [Paenibacillus glacialis]